VKKIIALFLLGRKVLMSSTANGWKNPKDIGAGILYGSGTAVLAFSFTLQVCIT